LVIQELLSLLELIKVKILLQVRVGKTFDEAQLNFYGGLKVYGDEHDLDFLKDIANSGIETQKEDISKYKPAERNKSFTKGIDEISDLYGEEGLSSAIDRGALLAKDMVATALGSFGLTGAAVLAGAAASPITGGSSLLVASFFGWCCPRHWWNL
jgi:hypothetical protein